MALNFKKTSGDQQTAIQQAQQMRYIPGSIGVQQPMQSYMPQQPYSQPQGNTDGGNVSFSSADINKVSKALGKDQKNITKQYGKGYNQFMRTMLPGGMAQLPNMMQAGAAALPGNNLPQQFAPAGSYNPVTAGLPQQVQQQGMMENMQRLLLNPTLLARLMSGSQGGNVPNDRDPPVDQRRGIPEYSSGYWGNDNEVT